MFVNLPGSALCSATYFLEGDYILSPFTFDTIMVLYAQLEARQWPTVDAFIDAQQQDKQEELKAAAEKSFIPALQYFNKRFVGPDALMAVEMERFKYARLSAPHQFLLHNATFPLAGAVKAMPLAERMLFQNALPFLNEKVHRELDAERAAYIALAGQFLPPSSLGKKKNVFMGELTDALLLWWSVNEHLLPKWAWFTRKMLLIQPSSASVERVFSIVNRIYSKDRYSTLNDMIELSVMLAYNK